MLSEEARHLGSPLYKGHDLYKDLQRAYLTRTETEKSNKSEDQPKIIGVANSQDEESGSVITNQNEEHSQNEERGYML